MEIPMEIPWHPNLSWWNHSEIMFSWLNHSEIMLNQTSSALLMHLNPMKKLQHFYPLSPPGGAPRGGQGLEDGSWNLGSQALEEGPDGMEGWDGMGDSLLQRFFLAQLQHFFWCVCLAQLQHLFISVFFCSTGTCYFCFCFCLMNWSCVSFFWKDVWFSNGTVFCWRVERWRHVTCDSKGC